MDNFSGSVVEPQMPQIPISPSHKTNKMLIVALIGIFIIIGLIIALIITNLPSSETSINFEEFSEIVENDIDEYEVSELLLNDSEKATLMYLYAIINDEVLRENGVPEAICQTLPAIYNNFSTGGSQAGNPCLDNQITLSSTSIESEDYPFLELIKLSFLANNQNYSYYIYTDFSALDHIEVSDPELNNGIIVMINRE